MKRLVLSSLMAFVAIFLIQCKKDTQIVTGGFPEQIVVTIPEAISSTEQTKAFVANDCGIPISGDSIYRWVKGFIKIGKTSANFVQDVFTVLKKYNIDRPMKFEFTGGDGNQKKVNVMEITANNAASFISEKYTMKLVLTPASDSTKKGMVIYWNKETKEGFAIVCPNICNSKEAVLNPNLIYKVEFSAVNTAEHEQRMIVSLAGFTPTSDIYFMNKLKMIVTKKGSIVTVRGNSNHPNAYLVDATRKGLSYSFVAKADLQKNIGVIKLAIPSINLDSTDVFKDYLVEAVLKREAYAYAAANSIPTTNNLAFTVCLSSLLTNAKAPAYYTSAGYQGCGATKPSADFDGEISVLDGLIPYAPKALENMALAVE